MFKKFLGFLVDTIQTITLSLSIFVIIYLFLGRPTQVLGYSMEPSLDNNDRLLVESISYRYGEPSRGDIVVVHSPVVEEIDYVKRVIGVPGNNIIIRDCKVFIKNNNKEEELAENYLTPNTCTKGGSKIIEGEIIQVPDSYYLVMGDNREHSIDGRFFGLIPKSAIASRAIVRYWPPEKWKIF